MKKIFLLSKMLSRGSGEGDKQSDQNADVVNIFLIVVFAIASFSAGMFLSPMSSLLIPNQTIATLLVVLAALLSLIRVFPMIINGLFMSKDVEVLLTLPFTPLQLALSNSINIVKTIGLYQLAASFPFAIGVFIAETGDIIGLIVMDIMFIIFIPIFVAFLIILLSTLIMKGLKTMANKEFQKIIGVVFVSIFLIVYCVFAFSNNATNAVQVDVILDTINRFSSFAWIIPVAPMIQDFVYGSNFLNLIYVLLIDGGLVALSFAALNAFYLPILKQVTNTFSSGKSVSDKTIKEASKKNSATSAIVKKDLKIIFRDSGYYLNCIIQPLLLVAIFLFGFYQIIDKFVLIGMQVGSITDIVSPLIISLAFGISLGAITASCLTALSGVSACSISREGQSYIFLKQMPIDYTNLLKAKRNVALIMSIPVGVLVIVVFSILGISIGAFNWIAPIIALIVFIESSIFFINYSILVDLKKPSLYATKMNKLTSAKPSTQVAGIIISIASMFFPLFVMMSPMLAALMGISLGLINALIVSLIIAVPVVFMILAGVFEKRMKTKGPELFNKLG